MKKRFPMGGGWSETEGGCPFLVSSIQTFYPGAGKISRKSGSEKIAAGKIAVWQGSTRCPIQEYARRKSVSLLHSRLGTVVRD